MNKIKDDFFPWSQGFETGDPSIDGEHKELVHMINNLAVLNAEGGGDSQLTELFGRLSNYVVEHFSNEERIMAEISLDHPHCVKHRAAHAAFVSKVSDNLPTILSSPKEVLGETLCFLTKWLVSHILGMDKELIDLNRQRLGLPSFVTPVSSVDALLTAFDSLYRNMRLNAERLEKANDQLAQQAISLAMFQQAVEHSPVSIIVTDIDGNIVYANPKCYDLTGYSSDELIGKTPAIFKSGMTDPSIYVDLWKIVSSGHEWSGEILNKKKDGTLFWERVQIAPIFPSPGMPHTHYVGIKTDVTSEREAETVLRDTNEKLSTALMEASRRTAEMAAINRLNELVLVCENEDEIYEALSLSASHIFTTSGICGKLYVPIGSELMRLALSFGYEHDAHKGLGTFPKTECWGVRRTLPHSRDSGSQRCKHSGHDGFCIPMHVDGEVKALLVADKITSGKVSASLNEASVAMCETLRIALSNISMRKRLHDLADLDSLLGIHSRGAYERKAAEIFTAAQIVGQEICIAMLDVDHFKSLNDTYGHRAGDEVLRHLGRSIKSNIPSSAWCARYGGEEIFILFPGFSLQSAAFIVEEIRNSFSSLPLKYDGRDLPVVTISAGIRLSAKNEDFSSVLREADASLYLAKTSGRNRISLSSPK